MILWNGSLLQFERTSTVKKHQNHRKNRANNKYFLGDAFPNVYLTQREAECMISLLNHGSTKTISLQLGLSPRTVEFYIRNIKAKLKCNSRSALIASIKKSDFIVTCPDRTLPQASTRKNSKKQTTNNN